MNKDSSHSDTTSRLDRALVHLGVGSRRQVQQLIHAGAVQVEGSTITEPQRRIVAEGTVLSVAGRELIYHEYCYIMLHKPAGWLSSTTGARSVLALLPQEERRPGLFPVGRLDADSEGLLLLSNDGQLAHDLLAPRHMVPKRYFIRCRGILDDAAVAAFAAGILLEDGERCLPARLILMSREDGTTCAEVVVCQGMFHQVKRMIAQVGAEVIYLRREAIGPLTLDPALALGGWRHLRKEEVAALYRAATT